MTNVTMRERIGATRGKLALVGVLAVVLVVIIVVQLPGPTDYDKAATASVSSIRERSTDNNDITMLEEPISSTEKTLIDMSPREWPELSIDAITAFDPLEAPSWYVAAAQIEKTNEAGEQTLASADDDASAAGLAALQEAGATIVLIANGERIATIGDQRIRIGDNIEGYQVSDITDQGVILTKLKPR